jgi:hypothetical protein
MSGIKSIKRTGYLHGGVTHPDGRRGFFKGAQADAAAGKGSMSPGTSGLGGSQAGGYGRDQGNRGDQQGDMSIRDFNTSMSNPDGRPNYKQTPPSKPKVTPKNKIKTNPFETYFNYNPTLSILDKITKSKFSTNLNAKRRADYLNDLLDTDPDEYNSVMSDLSKIGMITGPSVIGSKQIGPTVTTDYGMPKGPPSQLTSNFEEINGRKSLGDDEALEILGQKYKDTLPTFDGGDGGNNQPYLPIDYNTGAATTETVEPYTNNFEYRFGNTQGVGDDVTQGFYNQGGRARRAEGGIMELRARRAFGGIMDRVTGRKAYGLGSIFKSVKKAASKVLSSDIGKAAIIGAGIYYGGGGRMPFTKAFNNAGGFTGGGFGGFSLGPSTGGFFSKQNPLLFSTKNIKGVDTQVFNPWKMAGLITAGGAMMGPAKVDTLPGMNNRGGSLIDPLTGKEALPSEMRASLNEKLANADGDPIRIKQINDAYAFMIPKEELGTYVPYRTYGVKDGGRIGYGLGNLVSGSGMFEPSSTSMSAGDAPSFEGGSGMGGMIADLIRKNPNMFKRSKNTTPVNQSNNGMYSKMFNNSQGYFIDENMNGIDDREEVANGGRIGRAEGGLMDLGGMEKDYRAEGGFVPIGAKEKADDVPARLSVNEFVFTADAVRGAGQGDIDKGAEIMENMMKNLEKGGTISEESQGNIGAQQMFETSERLGEVI